MWCKRLFPVLMGTALMGLMMTQPVGAEEVNAFPVGDLKHMESGNAEWWNLPGIELNTDSLGKAELQGAGRLLLHTQKAGMKVQAGNLFINVEPRSVVFLDQVELQVRVMVLTGKAEVVDGVRQFKLTTSLQAVLCPEPNAGFFIDDGVYRRPFIQSFEDPGRKTLIRQFYLEQVVYSDPILRHLFEQGGATKRLVEKLNKTGAIFRDVNGTYNYEANQV
jgi:hypothetical protein